MEAAIVVATKKARNKSIKLTRNLGYGSTKSTRKEKRNTYHRKGTNAQISLKSEIGYKKRLVNI